MSTINFGELVNKTDILKDNSSRRSSNTCKFN